MHSTTTLAATLTSHWAIKPASISPQAIATSISLILVVAGESSTIRIGEPGDQTKTFIAGISGAAVSGSTVVVNTDGQLGVKPSSQRFKDAIRPIDNVSETILALKPVTFRYK